MEKYKEKRKRRKRNRYIAYGILLLASVSLACFLYARVPKTDKKDSMGSQNEVKESTQNLSEKLSAAKVGQADLTGLTITEAEETLDEHYQWDLVVNSGADTVLLDNLLEDQINSIKKKLEETPADQNQQYDIDYEALREPFEKQAEKLAEKWNQSAANSQLESFDKETGTYLYTTGQNGKVLDQENLVEQLMDAVESEDFQAEIKAEFSETPPERTQAQTKELYQVMGTFTTTTTDNKNRNQNISLAVGAINGLVLAPGEEFSFNNTTGNRTKEKGYQPAGAYRNGVLIEEPGGGVCQVSTTLYHAIIESGFKTTERNAHSYAPAYVEKGQDAMVSFDGYAGPDLKFVNSSSDPVVIRAALDGKQLKISIVGIPILEDGVKVTIRSEKVKDADPVAPTYEENTSLPYGTEKIVDQGTLGGVYKSYRVYKKGDEVIKEESLHNSNYKGKPAVIQRNTTVETSQEETSSETNTSDESKTASETQTEAETQTQEAQTVAGPGGALTQ